MPMTHWLEYYSVEPEETINKIGEDFYMVSDREVRTKSKVHRVDILKCKNKK